LYLIFSFLCRFYCSILRCFAFVSISWLSWLQRFICNNLYLLISLSFLTVLIWIFTLANVELICPSVYLFVSVIHVTKLKYEWIRNIFLSLSIMYHRLQRYYIVKKQNQK
jgi:hypothetical protein